MVDRQTLTDLSRKRDLPGILRLTTQLLALTISGTLILSARIETGVWEIWAWPMMAIHGALGISLFAPLHESVHRTAFASRWLNIGVATAIGFLLLLPRRFFMHFHFAHHRFTQVPGSDPELDSPKPRSWGEYAYLISGLGYWHRALGGLISRALGKVSETMVPESGRVQVVRESRIQVAVHGGWIGASIWFQSDLALMLWIIPMLFGQPLLRLYLMTEHWGCEIGKAGDREAIEDAIWRRTRSIAASPAVRFLFWNMPFHAEHHAHPGVPFHRLPDLARISADKPAVRAASHAGFHLGEAPALVREGRGA